MTASEAFTTVSAKPVARSLGHDLVFEIQTEGIRRLIWLYIVLWLVEGGLRRWFLPGFADPLLVIRDPVVLAIYYLSYTKRLFPLNSFIYSGLVLVVLSALNALAFGHGNAVVALRKANNFASSMAVSDKLFIDGVPIVPGALLSIDTADVTLNYDVLPEDRFTVRPISDIRAIGLGRFTAFACEPGQRAIDDSMYRLAGRSSSPLFDTLAPSSLQPLVQSAVPADIRFS